jgi:fructuronate reductase
MDEEISPTLPQLAGFDLEHYKDELIERFQNAALKHRTWQIAMDGSQKLPQRLLGTIRDRLRLGQSIDRLALGVAGWMRYAAGYDEKGAAIDVRDPLSELIQTRIRDCKTPSDMVNAYCSIEEVFDRELAANQEFRAVVETALSRLMENGASRTVAEFKPSNCKNS